MGFVVLILLFLVGYWVAGGIGALVGLLIGLLLLGGVPASRRF